MKSAALLNDFVQYCIANPEQRFWQALRNWSGYQWILAGDNPELEVQTEGVFDTFYFEQRRHDEMMNEPDALPPAPPKVVEKEVRVKEPAKYSDREVQGLLRTIEEYKNIVSRQEEYLTTGRRRFFSPPMPPPKGDSNVDANEKARRAFKAKLAKFAMEEDWEYFRKPLDRCGWCGSPDCNGQCREEE